MPTWEIDPSISILNAPNRTGEFRSTTKMDDSFTVSLVKTSIGEVPMEGYFYCQLDMQKWNQAWKEIDQYVDENLRTPNIFRETDEHAKSKWKFERLLNGIPKKGYIEAPVFSTLKYRVGEGRHRICLMRELGFESFIAAIPSCVVLGYKSFLTSELPSPIPEATYDGMVNRV